MIVKNDLFDYENRFIFQDEELFKFSLDSILVAEYTRKFIKKNDLIVDLCAGNMAISLIISKYTNSHITGFEIQNNIYDLGLKSIELNNLDNQLNIINDDANNIGNYFNNEEIDLIVCNPPFFKVGSSLENKIIGLSIARHEVAISLENIFNISKHFLKNKGSLIIVHRANRLDDIISLGLKYQVPVKNIQLISTKKGKKPSIVLVRAVKNASDGVIIESEVCIEGVKSYKNIFKEEL